MNVDELSEALDTVVRAHGVLSDFYKEVGAFFGIVDGLLHPEDAELQLEPEPSNAPYVVSYNPTKFADAGSWAPKHLGRFYRNVEAHQDEDEKDSDPRAFEKLAHAFVWVNVTPKDISPDAHLPECVAGVAHPGRGGKAKHLWDAARYGTWTSLPNDELTTGAWSEGTFPEKTGQFGEGGYWWARRIPLVELRTREDIETRLASPLLEKFAARFGVAGGKTLSVAPADE